VGKKPDYFNEAEDLYVVDGLTLEGIAVRLPVSVTTLSRWKQDGDWERLRAELATALAQIKRDTLLLRQKLVAEALQTLNPQMVYAVVQLARTAGVGASAGKEETKEPEIDRPALFLEDLKFVAKVLKETDPEGLKVVARNFEAIVARFKATHAQAS